MMQLDAILEVAIGLVMMWLILSVATMEIQNWLTQVLNTRAKFLEETLLEMFKNEKGLLEQFYNHPAIKELGKVDKKGNYKKPTYIPKEVFARVTMQLLTNTSKQSATAVPAAISFSDMAATVEQVKELSPALKDLMEQLFPGLDQQGMISTELENIQTRLKGYQDNMEKWFDHNMDNASIWYKENAANIAFLIGLGLAVIFNVDTINITNRLWREPTIRQALVAQADTYQLQEGTSNITEVPGFFDSLAMPIGWTSIPAADAAVCKRFVTFTADSEIAFWAGNECKILVNVPPFNNLMGWVIMVLGFFISASAARQGAPFWFDLLRKLVNLRSSTQPANKEEAKG
jgi:hypothetical protein